MPAATHLLCMLLFFANFTIHAQTVDGCPKNEHACLDVINSSFCLQSNVGSGAAADVLAQCVSYDGAASSLPGATKASLYIFVDFALYREEAGDTSTRFE